MERAVMAVEVMAVVMAGEAMARIVAKVAPPTIR